MSDLEQICLRLLSSNELFFPFFRVPFEKRGCLSETDLHHQRIVVPPQSAAAEIGRWRQYADGTAAKFDIVPRFPVDNHDAQPLRIL